MEKRLQEIELRKAEIRSEIEGADEARMAELKAEVEALETEERNLKAKEELRGKLGEKENKMEERAAQVTEVEKRAKAFVETGKTTIESRSLLVSGNTTVAPEKAANEINDMIGAGYSNIVDMIDVDFVTGAGSYSVPITTDGITPYIPGTEGTAVTASDATFAVVTLTPTDINTLSYVSKLVAKANPVDYEAKVKKLAGQALRQKYSKTIVDAVLASSLTASVTVAKNTSNGAAIDEKTLRSIALAYGNDEAVEGQAVLFLNKTDLQGFGDVRGTNEKKAVYEILPDPSNANIGVIKDGGLVVPYCLNKNCTALTGNKTTNGKTMIYGNPKAIKGAIWGDYEVQMDGSYKFAEGLDTIRGDVYAAADLAVKNGFVVVTLA